MPVPAPINLNDRLPAARPGRRLISWQADNNTPRNTTGEYIAYGGASVKTSSYSAIDLDYGQLLTFFSTSPTTLTLPATPPDAGWSLFVENMGRGLLTIDPNGRQIDKSSASLLLNQNQGIYLTTDGTDYYTERGMASSFGGVKAFTTSYSALLTDSGKLLVANSASALQLTLPNPPPTTTWSVFVQNDGAGLLTISRNSLLIDYAAADLTLGQGEGLYLATDGTNYFTQRAGRRYDVTLSMPGKPPANCIVAMVPFDIALTFPANFSGSFGYRNLAAGTDFSYTLRKVGSGIIGAVDVGTVTIGNGVFGTFAFASASSAIVTFNPGQTMLVYTPIFPDVSLSDVAVTFAGYR